MQILANGYPLETCDGQTVIQLLGSLRAEARFVLVEINGVPIDRRQFESTVLQRNDVVEIIRMVGGG